jgi:hypothetical protein
MLHLYRCIFTAAKNGARCGIVRARADSVFEEDRFVEFLDLQPKELIGIYGNSTFDVDLCGH